ncbi:MAG: 2-hydroxyacyl-CoA dehydratase family protein [Desulfobacterota bacterium]|nr:2-hydroxyacyl-CoA dehydratase family protein [Thermodesulfobacteriota bacterium]MDW8001718.1 2-hydroxyacyl-CoA dehydratase family protein [Deltaproteobacteria bacterium]
MWEDMSLEDVVRCASDPYPSIREWKRKSGKKVIGTTFADVPEEVIQAFDILPVTLMGTTKPLKRAQALLPDNACSLARSNLELVLSYETDLFDGFVLPQVCDTTQHMSDIWRINVKADYFESFLAPRQVDRPSAKYWVRKEIDRLIDSLKNFSGKDLGPTDLKRSVEIHNENKRLLKEIYSIKNENPSSVSSKEFFSMVKISQQVDKGEFNRSLKKIKDSLKPGKKEGYIDVILCGITCEPIEIYGLFDELKLNVIADNLLIGSRYLEGEVEDGEDLIDKLTERHFKRGFFSPIHGNVFAEFEQIKKLYKEKNAKAVIYVHIEFCESQEYDLPDLKRMMKQEGIPMHVIETEYQTTSLSHIRTRLQAFIESIKGI